MKTDASNVDFAVSAPPSKRLAARRAAFLSAAREVFQQKGFAEATLDDVIARSGGSRQTLYALFGGKQGLFEALVTETCWSIFGGLTPEKLASQSPDLVLTEVGVRYLEIVLSPPVLNLTRLVVAEASRIPEIAETYWRLGPGRSRAFLTAFFDRQIERGSLEMQDSRKGADHFLEMLSGTIRFQCLIGVRQPPDGAEIREIVAAAVTQFLNGCATAPGAASLR
jgi:TetR/AcrR family transcriptional repressor of mexJK operon